MSKNCPVCHRKNLDNARSCWICGAVLSEPSTAISTGDGSIYTQAISSPTLVSPEATQAEPSKAVRVLGILGSVLAVVTASLLLALVVFCLLIISSILALIAMIASVCGSCAPP